MHQRLDERVSESFEYQKNSEPSQTFSFSTSLRSFRRHYRLIIVTAAICLGLGSAYVLFTQKQYTADTTLLIEPDSYSKIGKDQTSSTVDSADVDSQVEVLKSERIARAVISKFNLLEDPEFNRPSLAAKVATIVSDKTARDTVMQRVLASMARKTNVKRIDKTYVIDVTFTSKDPDRASQIANAITEAYLQEQLDAKFAITNKAVTWLGDRLNELKDKSINADAEAQRYRTEKGLIESGGRLVNDQQVSQINTQLTQANLDAEKADARFANIQAVITSRHVDASVTDSLSNPIITDLRTKYLAASKRAAELTARLGAKHQQVIALQDEIQSYEDQIFSELSRIADSYANDAKIAHSRQGELQKSLDSALGVSATDNQNLVDLRERERQAEIYNTQYQSFLSTYQDLLQQQSYPIAKARVLTRADPPTGPSQPKIKLILAIGLVAGLALGCGIVMMREAFDQSFRSADQVKALKIAFLGAIPDYSKNSARRDRDSGGTVGPSWAKYLTALSQPLSSAADTLRSAKLAADETTHGDGKPVIGLISINSGDGKTYVAASFAGTLARGGHKVLIIDADLRRHGLTKMLISNPTNGLADILEGRARIIDECIVPLQGLGVDLLPAAYAQEARPSSADMLTSARMAELLSELKSRYDYIVVDLPPTAPLADAKAVSTLLTGTLVVVTWGKTLITDVSNLFAQAPLIHRKCIGAIYNRADSRLLNLYSNTPTRGYSENYY